MPARTTTNPRGLGRKPRARETSSVNVTFRLTPSEREAYRRAADAANLTLGDWIRECCAAKLATGRKRKV